MLPYKFRYPQDTHLVKYASKAFERAILGTSLELALGSGQTFLRLCALAGVGIWVCVSTTSKQ